MNDAMKQHTQDVVKELENLVESIQTQKAVGKIDWSNVLKIGLQILQMILAALAADTPEA